ncbi:hypothetical protein [Paracoccus sp. KR1-242]|uniref:hypothetical protein n=1 Tax=Paracoccus sp. KR1-242 TaxID=3410028 RepID=UPI003C30AA43
MQKLRGGTLLAFLALLPIRRRAFVGLQLGLGASYSAFHRDCSCTGHDQNRQQLDRDDP